MATLIDDSVLSVVTGNFEDAPHDSKVYGRKNGNWKSVLDDSAQNRAVFESFDVTYNGHQLFDSSTPDVIDAWINVPDKQIVYVEDTRSIIVPIEKNKYYTLSVGSSVYGSNRMHFGWLDHKPTGDNESITLYDFANYHVTYNGREYYSFQTTSTAKYLVIFVWRNTDSWSLQNVLDSLMLSESTEKYPYEKYDSGTATAIIRNSSLPSDVTDVVDYLKVVSLSGDYLYAILDNNDTFLFGINRNGAVDWGKGVPYALQKYIDNNYKKIYSEVFENDKLSMIDKEIANGLIVDTREKDYLYLLKDGNDTPVFGVKTNGEIYTSAAAQKFYQGFDTVEDMLNSKSAKFATTRGFYEPNDGGGASYVIVDILPKSESVNGMDIIQMKDGRIAKLIYGDEICVDCIGMKKNDETYNLRDYMEHIVRVMKRNVILLNAGWYWDLRPWIVPHTSVKVIGKHWMNGEDTRILFRSTRTDSGASVFVPEFSEFVLENVNLYNADRQDAHPEKPPRKAVYCYLDGDYYGQAVGHRGFIFKNITVGYFDVGFELGGKIKWNMQFDNVRCSQCRIGAYVWGHALVCNFSLFYPDHCSESGIVLSWNSNAISFDHCNFGTINNAVKLLHGPEGFCNMHMTFNSCSFEVDENVTNKNALFLDVEDDIPVSIGFIGCNFNWGKLRDNCHCFAFGNGTKVYYLGCQGPENGWYTPDSEYDYQALWDPTRPPKKEIGSLTIGPANTGLFPPAYADDYKPCIVSFINDTGTPKTKNIQSFTENGYEIANGGFIYSEDDDTLYVKTQAGLKKIKIN